MGISAIGVSWDFFFCQKYVAAIDHVFQGLMRRTFVAGVAVVTNFTETLEVCTVISRRDHKASYSESRNTLPVNSGIVVSVLTDSDFRTATRFIPGSTLPVLSSTSVSVFDCNQDSSCAPYGQWHTSHGFVFWSYPPNPTDSEYLGHTCRCFVTQSFSV